MAVDERLPGVMAEIRSLLDLPADAELPPRAEVEDTLTSGYAYALDLERERLRIERNLRTMLRSEARPSQSEITDASSRLADADDKLAGVRAMLALLRAQALG